MANRAEGKKKGLTPIDVNDLMHGLQLGIGQAATLCGVSVRQLSYWTDKGIIQPVDEDRSRTYDYAAVEKVCLIKQSLDQGYSLEGAVQEADAFLKRRDEEQHRVEQLSEADLEQLILQRANQLQQLAERIRREIRTYRVSGDLGKVAGSLSGVERLIAFFEANPYTVSTARQIALRLGREVTEVEHELDLLEQKKFIQKISYPGSDVYRYIPQRRH
ncbi:MAG: MerR family transcriptional regulator [Armatimonadota bacterium]|nr:MAG: MerR family transcriptional regulator [Armatimonadota bacterium]